MFDMTILFLFFWLTCLLCFVIAFRFGERDEKRGMMVIAIGSMLTALVGISANNNFQGLTFRFLVVDLCVFAAFIRIMFDSRKYWPVWVGSLQLIAVIVHFLDLLVPRTIPAAYIALQGFWVYPMFCAVMAGVYGSRVAMRRNQAL